MSFNRTRKDNYSLLNISDSDNMQSFFINNLMDIMKGKEKEVKRPKIPFQDEGSKQKLLNMNAS